MKTYIVVPLYQEEQRFDVDYFNQLLKIPNTYWLLVDDGSTDKTFELINELRSRYTNLEIKSNPINKGKTVSILDSYRYLVNSLGTSNFNLAYLDGDGAFAISDIKRIILMGETSYYKLNYFAIYSSRLRISGRDIRRKNSRHLIGRLVLGILRLRFTNLPYDTQCGFKLYLNIPTLNLLLKKSFRSKWFFDIELIKFSRTLKPELPDGLKIWEEPLNNWRDVEGSKLSFKSAPAIIFEMLDLIKRK